MKAKLQFLLDKRWQEVHWSYVPCKCNVSILLVDAWLSIRLRSYLAFSDRYSFYTLVDMFLIVTSLPLVFIPELNRVDKLTQQLARANEWTSGYEWYNIQTPIPRFECDI